MIVLYIFLGILAVLLLLLAVCAIRAATVKQTPKKLDEKADESRAKNYSKTLSEMVKIPTVSSIGQTDYTEFEKFHTLLETLFPLTHKHLERKIIEHGLIYHWKGETNDKAVVLMSHHDVVSATGDWTHEPFGGEIKDGVIWGRGTFDTKGSLFAIFQSVEELLAKGYKPKNDLYITSGCDEETDSLSQTQIVKYLTENKVKIGLVIDEGGAATTDPMGGVKGAFAMIGVAEKGYADIKFVAKSKGGHASVQQKNTPIAKLAAFITYLEKHDPFTKKMNPTIKEMFTRMAPYSTFAIRLIFSNLWLFGGLLTKLLDKISPSGGAMVKTTYSFTTCGGSESLNVLPDTAYVTANVRFIFHQDMDESIVIFGKIADKFGLEMEVLQSNPACKVVSYQSDMFRMVERIITDNYKDIVVSPYVMTGATDGRHYNALCDNVLRFSPVYAIAEQIDSMHSLNENIYINSLPKAVDFYKQVIEKYNEKV
ncbi:MAG TPA: M20/M25/M40 family metallo-hydrolase [Clostridia bacterium]|nr:M20/M25/M40 family metallo-hydrolase [Clostridia bacterium]